MEQIEYIQQDLLVQPPGTFEYPDGFPDYIAVAAEECSPSFSQGSSSPETFISTSDDILDDLPNVNEDVANEIVNDMVCEDPSFGSVLIDSDISEILQVEPDDYEATLRRTFGASPNNHIETPTRRKQRIVPKISEPFEDGVTLYDIEDIVQQTNARTLKRPAENLELGFEGMVGKKKMRTSTTQAYLHDERLPCNDGLYLPFLKNETDFGNSQQSIASGNDKQNVVRQRKRGLTQDERKERKKQSNRNASYRYRQRKKDEMDGFFEQSRLALQALEDEKEAYQHVVEDFKRCIKHAQLVSDARCERKYGLLLKA